jgi:cytochrome c-type biogenesis protein CcmH/NrfG
MIPYRPISIGQWPGESDEHYRQRELDDALLYSKSMTKKITLKQTLLIIIIVWLLITIPMLSVAKYNSYKADKQAQQTLQDAKDTMAAKQASDRESKFNTDINRLISICFDSQQRYDQLTAKDQAKTYRPNCDLSPR